MCVMVQIVWCFLLGTANHKPSSQGQRKPLFCGYALLFIYSKHLTGLVQALVHLTYTGKNSKQNNYFFLSRARCKKICFRFFPCFFVLEISINKRVGNQGCQIFLGTWNQNRKNVPNGHKISQISVKYSKWP
jgi:hypothetical protein